MNESDLLRVLKELQVYSSPWKPVSSQSISCQTDFDENNNCDYPVIFCSQFSPEFDVQTQCNIPQSPLQCKSCKKSLSVEDASTQYDITSVSIDYVFSKAQSTRRPIKLEEKDSYDITATDTFFQDEEELNSVREVLFKAGGQPNAVKFEHEEVSDCKYDKKDQSSEGAKVKTTKIHVTCDVSEDEGGNYVSEDDDDFEKEEFMEDDRLSDSEPRRRVKLPLTYSDKELFYSDDEMFWKEMNRRKKKINMKKRSIRKRKDLPVPNKQPAETSFRKNAGEKSFESIRTPVFPVEVNKTQTFTERKGIEKNSYTPTTQNSERACDKIRVEVNNENVEDIQQILRSLEADWITDGENDDDDADDEFGFESAVEDEWTKSFLCHLCGKRYARSHVLREHIVRKHGDNEMAKAYTHRCVHCKRVYNDARHLKSHLSHFRGPCEVCGMTLECKGAFVLHRRQHDAHCEICNKSFSDKPAYMFHMKSFHDKQRYPIKCEICGRGFMYPSQLKTHLERLHPNPSAESCAVIYKCEDCEFCTANIKSLQIHKGRMHSKYKTRVCNVCNTSFYDMPSFMYHVESAHKNGRNECEVCGRGFMFPSQLKLHIKRLHPNQSVINTYKCDECDFCTTNSKSLPIHKTKVHGKFRTYLRSVGSRNEKNCFSAEKIIKCEICQAHFKSRDDLANHKTLAHPVSGNASDAEILSTIHISYPCFPCHQTFVTADDLQAHILSVHDVPSHDLQEPDGLIQETVYFPEEGNPESATDNFSINPECDTAFSLPVSVVPSDVDVVEIDGVQYRVIRS